MRRVSPFPRLCQVVAYLDEEEFTSTWLGNKSIYRTRMAIADGGELIVLAPGVKKFGEDPGIDALIRKVSQWAGCFTYQGWRPRRTSVGGYTCANQIGTSY